MDLGTVLRRLVLIAGLQCFIEGKNMADLRSIWLKNHVGWDVTVMLRGRQIDPTHPIGAKTMQEIIPHYVDMYGIDRFAYMGQGCLKAAGQFSTTLSRSS